MHKERHHGKNTALPEHRPRELRPQCLHLSACTRGLVKFLTPNKGLCLKEARSAHHWEDVYYLLTETESSPAVDSSEGHKVILLAINLTTKNLFGEQILMNPKPRGIDSSVSHTKSFVLLMTQSPNSIIYLCSSCVHYCVLHPKFYSE